jgi:hypothetical protein
MAEPSPRVVFVPHENRGVQLRLPQSRWRTRPRSSFCRSGAGYPLGMGAGDPPQVQATDSDFRLLVVATSSNISEPVQREIDRRAAGRRTKTMVVVPALAGSRFEQAAGDVDDAIAHADEQRKPAAEEVRKAGAQLVTEPRIGDSDPILAIEDALREFPAQEILIVTRPAEEAAWMEEDLFDHARERFSQPIAHFVLDTTTDEVVDVERAEAGDPASNEVEVRDDSDNLPPFSVRDLLGIGVAVFGTGVLIVLAASCDDLSTDAGLTDSGLSGCAARLLIAGALGLANLAHIVGLMLFQTVRYRGFWRDFFARLSLYGTLVGIIAALLVHH